MRNRKYLAVLAVLLLAIGFATVSTVLYINGTINVAPDEAGFKEGITFKDVSITNGTVASGEGLDTITFTTEDFSNIGDEAVLTYKIDNASSYDAKVTGITCRFYNSETSEYDIKTNDYVSIVPASGFYPVTVNKGATSEATTLTVKQIKSYAGTSESNEFTLKYQCKLDVTTDTDAEATGDTLEASIPDPVSFATDSWATIAKAVKNNNISLYNVGDTKTITLAAHTNDCSSYTGDGETYACISSEEAEKTVTLRIANKSNCTNGETSETACGFVIEFADIIENHNYNKADATNISGTNAGGWPASELRTYINGTIYNALPSELQSVIAETTVVSSHGSTSGEINFTSKDKLYLLSAHEVWSDGTSYAVSTYDTSYSETRQLDYYANLGVKTDNNSGAIKQYNGSNTSWWLRSIYSYDDDEFFSVSSYGNWNSTNAYDTYGVSPAFRIA